MGFTKIDERLRMSESETHVYFVGGHFSQWYRRDFTARLPHPLLKREHRFNCAEQFMMACKAVLFDDIDTLLDIMQALDPKDQKALGRQVQGYDDAKWREHAREFVFQGNMAKFGQNPDLAELLRETIGKTLVEGAWYDPVWGVKLAYNDPLILDPANWQGTNWLGEVLMRVRSEMFGC